jgi:hypothetical protein
MAKKKYRVVAEDSVVAGHKTGEEFEADFTEFEESHLIAAGAIEVAEKAKPAKKES